MMFRDLILLTRIVFSFIWQNKQKEAKDGFNKEDFIKLKKFATSRMNKFIRSKSSVGG